MVGIWTMDNGKGLEMMGSIPKDIWQGFQTIGAEINIVAVE